jgi:hypothetical protein
MTHDTFSRALLATARIACFSAVFACDAGDCADADTTPADATDTAGEAGCAVADCESSVKLDFAMGSVTGETEDCCQLIAEHYDELMETDTTALDDWESRDDCCSLLDWQGSMACTPWGPPRPPVAGGFSRQDTARQVAAVRQAALA